MRIAKVCVKDDIVTLVTESELDTSVTSHMTFGHVTSNKLHYHRAPPWPEDMRVSKIKVKRKV